MSKSNQNQLPPESYTQLRGCSPRLCERIGEILALGDQARVLDVGCGPGVHTALLAGLLRGRVEGFDLDIERIDHARRTYAALTFHQGDAEAMPFEAATFDSITTMLAVQRFQDRTKVLSEFFRVLSPDGRLAIVTVSPEQLAARADFQCFPTALQLECHRFPQISVLIAELGERGFTEIKTEVFSEIIRPIDRLFVDWVRQYPFSVLRQIPESEFEEGIAKLKERIATATAVQLHRDEYTIITAYKP